MAKSTRTAFSLGLFFGPLGLLYVGRRHVFASCLVVIALAATTGGWVWVLAPFLCAFWGHAAVKAHHEELAAESAYSSLPPERLQVTAQGSLITSTDRAERFAHMIADDLVRFNSYKLEEAMRNNSDPVTAVREEIEEGRGHYTSRVSPDLAGGVLLF